MTSTTAPAPLSQASLHLADDAASGAFGRKLARGLFAALASSHGGLVLYFAGDLGAGKTTVVRALLQALGVTGRIKSPTFTLVEPYELSAEALTHAAASFGIELKRNLSLYCYHFDFYRFTDPREFVEAGFREHFHDDSICLVEWPERIRSDFTPGASAALPDPDLVVRLAVAAPPAVTAVSAGASHDTPGRAAQLAAFSARGAQCLAVAAS